MQSPIQESAVKCMLKIKCWPAAAHDKEVGDKVWQDSQAKREPGTYRKKLVDHTHLRPLRSIATDLRKYFNESTLPWGDSARICPAVDIQAFAAEIGRRMNTFKMAVDQFCNNYVMIVEAERVALGTLFNENDYPSVDEIKSKFDVDFTYGPIEDSSDIRIKASQSIIDRVREEAKKAEDEKLRAASGEMLMRVKSAIEKMLESIERKTIDKDTGDEKFARFSKGVFEGIAEATRTVRALNVYGDPVVLQAIKTVEDRLAAINVHEIKGSQLIRELTAKTGREIAADIENKMSFYLGGMNGGSADTASGQDTEAA